MPASHVPRPPASVRLATGLALPGVPGTVGLPYSGFRYITAEAHGQGCGLRASIPLQSAYSSPQSPSRLHPADQHQHQAVRPPSRNHLRSRSGIYRMRYGGGTVEPSMSIRVEQVSPPVVPGISIPAIIVLQTLHNCRIYVHLSWCGPYIQISQSSATAKTSHRQTKDARTHISHTPGSDEPRTQTDRISHRNT